MIARFLDRLQFDTWIGSLDGRPTLWTRDLLRWRGWRVRLHRMVSADDPGCFHTHPAWAFRLILAGGYIEEREDGESFAWLPGAFGIVRPSLSHRIERLIGEPWSYSLWVRAPKTREIQLNGPGWPARSGDA